MSTEQLEQRLAAVEQALAAIQQQLRTIGNGAARTLPPPDPRPMTPEEEEMRRWVDEYGRYYRKTGKEPPPDWKPGDPLPEPVPGWYG